ncbi:MAG: TraB/GumN family protein [Campylobacterota bacterium]|nr:TraB/GumN family protein [Campylobacterota bacterium]
MKLFKLLTLLLSLTILSVANEAIKHPFLWEVKKGEQTFYLFGTMHLGDPKLQTLPKALKVAIDKSDEVRTEIPMDASFQMKNAALMLRSDNKSLQEIIPKSLYQRTENYIKQINPQLNLVPFDKMKIWALSVVISMLENQLKYPMVKAIDSEIYRYAQSKNKSVGGIETIEEQIAAMDMFTLEEQIMGLESILDYLEQSNGFIEEMKSLYMLGDEKKMMAFIEGTMFKIEKYKKFEEKFIQVLLYDRNRLMTQRIESLLKEHPTKRYLFAFGVMHFLGEKSVVEYLEYKGYNVNRVNRLKGKSMNFEQLDSYLLKKPGATFDYPFDEKVRVYRIAEKMFALTADDVPLEVNLKCDPIYALELRSIYEGVRAGYHMNKKHWNTVTLTDSDVDDESVKELIDHSYDLVFSKLTKKQKEMLQREML